MCEHGKTVEVQVVVPAYLSFTGEARLAVKPIDSCIAIIVATLNWAGYPTANSCCGHGKIPPVVVMVDGSEVDPFGPWVADVCVRHIELNKGDGNEERSSRSCS